MNASSDETRVPAVTDSAVAELQLENERLHHQLVEARDTLRALSAGEVDAVVVDTDPEQVYTLDSANKPYRLLVEQMPQAAASFTVDGIILHGNLRFAGLLGQPLEMLVGKSIYDFLAPESRVIFASLLREVQAAEVRTEVTLQRVDGTLVPAYLGINALREGPLGMCLVMTDLTEQKHYVELKRAQEALQEADRRKNEFVAILAHELRNPLGPIRNAARILKLKGPPDPELRSPIEMIERQAEQLARLLDDLLDVSRITRGALEMRRERVALSDLVYGSVTACHEDLQHRNVTLHLNLPTDPADLVADRARLIQVFCNLISNAAKYTRSGGKVELTATVSGDTLTLSVKDDGIGIPHDRLADIFDLFAQVDRTGDRTGGLGIGLTLVRQIATLHGGTVEARSGGIGQGSEFVLTLPIVISSAPQAPNPVVIPAVGQPVTPRRVLIVDDNRDAAESLTMLLRIAGHDANCVLDGESAIEQARRDRPEVMLLDLGMPNVDGYEVARRVREQSWGKQIFLVALSGWGQAEEKLRTRQSGFDAHLVKPVAPETLAQLLETMSARPAA